VNYVVEFQLFSRRHIGPTLQNHTIQIRNKIKKRETMNSAGFPYKRYDNPHIYAAPSYIFLTAYSPFFYVTSMLHVGMLLS
jgi:hypothetical protein